MALQHFDRMFAFIKGDLQAMMIDCNVEWQGDPLPAQTMGDDLAGFTQVPKSVMITCNSYVPSKGVEFDPVKSWNKGEFLEIKAQFGGSGKQITSEGTIMAPSISSSATDATKLGFKFQGKSSDFS